MSGGPTGFRNAPVARAFVVISTVLTVAYGIRDRGSARFGLPSQVLFRNISLWKLFSSVFAFSSTPELIFGLYLLYYFRVFERQIGSNKYSVFILFSTVASIALQILTLAFIKDSSLGILASGPYGIIFSSFVPFFFDIPVSSRFRVFGINFSDKSLIYLAGLQLLLSSWKRSLLPGVCGVFAGSLYRANIFGIRRAKLPGFVVSFFSRLFLPSRGGSSRTLLARNTAPSPYFGSRQQEVNYVNAAPIMEPSQESIATLVSMGFDMNSARQALVRARNDINVATNMLLESQSH